MTRIQLAAFVTEDERPALSSGEGFLSKALEAETFALTCTVASTPAELLQASAGTIRLISLATQLASLDVPWPVVQAELRAWISETAEAGDPVLVTTVFRYIPAVQDPEGKLLTRVRRLNLFAAELSREFGVFVVDLDRVLTDIGGMALNTDYRLQGKMAADVAGQALALCVATNALDLYMPFEVQERTVAYLRAHDQVTHPEAVLTPANLMSLGSGRRRQRVSTNTDAVQEDQVRWLVGQVFKGKISLTDASQKLVMAVRRRGVKESFTLLAAGMVRFIGRRGTA
jgi:hypothetical protein